MMPILAVARDAAHLDPQDQANVIHGNFGQETMKSGSPIGRLATASLVFVNEQDPVLGPSQGLCKVDQGVLPFPRFDVIEYLLRVGLANVDDCQPTEVSIIEGRLPQPEAGRYPRGDRASASSSDR
jgi:hypothetical protein